MVRIILRSKVKTKMVEAKLTSKHQITIPKELRKMFEIKRGDRLIFLPFGDKIILEKKRKVKLADELPLKIKVAKVENVHEWRELAKEEAKKRGEGK